MIKQKHYGGVYMNLVESIVGDKISTSGTISSNFKNMFEAGQSKNDDEEFDVDEELDEESDFARSYKEFAELVTQATNAEVNMRTSRVVVPVRNGNATVVVPTDKEEKSNLVTKITALLPNSSDKKAVEKLNSHTVEELEVFYKQLQGKADALSEEDEFDLD
jgi:hypothetical protein